MRARVAIARVALALTLVFALCSSSASAQDEPHEPSVDPRAYESCSPREAPALERCAYVRENPLCARDVSFLPYLEWHYCALRGDAFASGMGATILTLGLFAALATTAERFFVPALKNVSRALRLSDDIAGATLLSFGNGAPDIFAQIAALSHRDAAESLALAVGAVTGAGTFIASFVFPCVIVIGVSRNGGEKLALNRWAFARDVGFYFVAAALACGFFLDGSVEAVEAASLFGLYLAYLFALLAKRRVRRVWNRMRSFFNDDSDSDSLEWSDDEDELHEPMLEEVGQNRDDEAEEEREDVERADGERDEAESGDDHGTASTSDTDEARRPVVREIMNNLSHAFKKLKIPLITILRLTMPELGRSERLALREVIALPIVAPLFMLVATGILPGSMSLDAVCYGIAVSIFCSFILAHAWPHIDGMRSIRAVLTTLAFFQSVLWMNTVASEVVSLLSAIGKVSGVSEALLGATVLAWGNSVGDFVSNTVVAYEGNPNMAIAACFAGPLMNLLVGTSFGLLLHISQYGPVTGYVMPNELVLLCGGLLFALGYALIIIPLVHRWRIGKTAAYGMIAFYVLFSIIYALTSTHKIFAQPWIGPPQ